MDEKQKENLNHLFELIKENPDLPIVPMVDHDVLGEYENMYYIGKWSRSFIEDYIITDEKVIFKSMDDDFDIAFDYIKKSNIEYEKIENMNEDELKRFVDSLPWIKAIIVYIDSL